MGELHHERSSKPRMVPIRYVWDGTGNRRTAPIRNVRNKSHMPVEHYPLDHYPPFCSGCGFVLSWDLVLALTHR